MYHDKNYFPDASDVYPGAETMVQDEDTQPLETPIIAPVKEKCFEVVERSVPETTFDFRFLTALMDTPSLVRNVALVGHLHHVQPCVPLPSSLPPMTPLTGKNASDGHVGAGDARP